MCKSVIFAYNYGEIQYIYNLKLLIIIATIFAAICFVSCSKDKDDNYSSEIELTVASKKAMSEDWGGISKERNVIRESDDIWQILFNTIDDFQYEDGYEYRLKVRKITPSKEIMDAYTSYELIEQLSKEKKTTIFQLNSYTISNNASVEGVKLSSADRATIEDKIKQSSPFNGMNSLTLEFTDFYFGVTPKSRACIYRTNTGKSGNCNITLEGEAENEIVISLYI